MLRSPQWDDRRREEPMAWYQVGPLVVYLEQVYRGSVNWCELYSTVVIPQPGAPLTVEEIWRNK